MIPIQTQPRVLASLRLLAMTTALAALTACTSGGGGGGGMGGLDWDFRGGGGLDTTGAAQQATASRPMPDGRGVISYPGYQVAVARRGDTVGSVASRIGLSPAELASYNAIDANSTLREGEVLALPRRVADGGIAPMATTGTMIGGGNVAASPLAAPGSVNVSAIATTALDRVGTTPVAPAATAAAPVAAAPAAAASGDAGGMAPTRHQVKRGETAFTIARQYNVSARALADWNGLGPDLAVREGQYLMIPTPTGAPVAEEPVTQPGSGTPTPPPPSAAKPLPEEDPPTAAEVEAAKPASPDLSSQRTAASSSQFVMPVSGSIIRGYDKKSNGIDISAPAGTPVKAAAAGTVAAITTDTEQTPIIVIRHDGGLLTVYAGVAGTTVKKGDTVTKGQTIATVRSGSPSFLHFEVRRGVDSTDPTPFLQ